MLCGLSGNFWRILSNPPFLLIKGSQIALTWTYFPLLCFFFFFLISQLRCRFAQICTLPRPCLIAFGESGSWDRVREIGLGISFVRWLLCPASVIGLNGELKKKKTYGRSCVWVRNVKVQLTSRLSICVLSLGWCLLNSPEVLSSSSHWAQTPNLLQKLKV